MDDVQVTVADVVRLMAEYLDGRIGLGDHRTAIFALFKKRIEPLNEQTSRILQQVYGDADDYDATIRLPYTIEEPEVKRRVKRSMDELASLGHGVPR